MNPPKAVTAYMQEFRKTEEEVHAYILQQLDFFATIPNVVTTPARYLALKMHTTVPQAELMIHWALQPLATHKEPCV